MSIQEKISRIVRMVQEGHHPSDMADLIEELSPDQQQEIFALLSDSDAAEIIQEMEEIDQVSLFRLLTRAKATSILRAMATDDAADLLGELSPEETREFLRLIGEEGEELQGLLRYPEDTAGGIMTTEYISLPEEMPVEEAITRLREIAPDAETVYYVYVVDKKGRLTGVLSLRELISASDGTPLREIMHGSVISVSASVDQEDVARLVSRYDLLAVPVVDDSNRLLGIITVDDILDVIEEEATEDFYRIAGTTEVEEGLSQASIWSIASHRLPWLIIGLLGGVISGTVIDFFGGTLEKVVTLAVFIPVIMDMGGNVGTQSSTIFVRGLATGEVDSSSFCSYLIREILVGVIMGFVCGALISAVAYFWQGNPVLGVVVGLAMVGTVSLATFIGVVIPMLFNYLGIDPAITAGPLVTTIKDITGLVIYLLIATALLKYLV